MFSVLGFIFIFFFNNNIGLVLSLGSPRILIASSLNNNLNVFDIFDGKCSLNFGKKISNLFAITKDGSTLFTVSLNDNSIIIWNTLLGINILNICCFDSNVTALELSDKENYLIWATSTRDYYIYNIKKKYVSNFYQSFFIEADILNYLEDKNLYIIAGQSALKSQSCQCQLILSFDDNNKVNVLSNIYNFDIDIKDTHSGQLKSITKMKNIGFLSTPKENFLLLSSYNGNITIRKLDVNVSDTIKFIKSHNKTVNALSFNEANGIFATISSDNYFSIWNFSNFTFIRKQKGHNNSALVTVDFLEDGKYLAIGHDDGTINIWNMNNFEIEKTIKTTGSPKDRAFFKVKLFNINLVQLGKSQCYLNSVNNTKYELGTFQEGINFGLCKNLEKNCDECSMIDEKLACLKNGQLCNYNCLKCNSDESCFQCRPDYYLHIGTKNCTKCTDEHEYIDLNNSSPEGSRYCLNASECSIPFCKKCSRNYSDCAECFDGYSLSPRECKDCSSSICVYENESFFFYLILILLLIGAVMIYFLFKKLFKKNQATTLNESSLELGSTKLTIKLFVEEEKLVQVKPKSFSSSKRALRKEKVSDQNPSNNNNDNQLSSNIQKSEVVGINNMDPYQDKHTKSKSDLIDFSENKGNEDNEFRLHQNQEHRTNQRNSSKSKSVEKSAEISKTEDSEILEKLTEYLPKCSNQEEFERALKDKEFIGKGGFGEVYKIKFNSSTYAVKLIKEDKLKALKEISIFMKAQCKQVAEICWVTVIKEECLKIYIVMEYFRNSLSNELKSNPPNPFTRDEIIWIFVSLLKGLKHFENLTEGRQLIHCDIKPGNVLINRKRKKVVFADFGIGSMCERGKSIKVYSCTKNYSAPEVIIYNRANTKSDLYSLGLTVLNILGIRIERCKNYDIDWNKIRSIPLPNPQDIQFYDELISLIKDMLAFEARDRPNTDQIFKKLKLIKKL